jgi:hypothetical protein
MPRQRVQTKDKNEVEDVEIIDETSSTEEQKKETVKDPSGKPPSIISKDGGRANLDSSTSSQGGWEMHRFGNQVQTPQAKFLAMFLGQFGNEMVNVPLEVVNSLIVFNYESELKTFDEFKDMGERSIDALLTTVSKIISGVDNSDIVKLFSAQGVKIPNKTAQQLVDGVKERITNTIIQGGIPNLIIKNALSDPTSYAQIDRKDIPSLSSFSTTFTVISKFYGKFAMSDGVADVASFVEQELWAAPGIKTIRHLYRLFQRSSAPTTPGRFGYIANTIVSSVLGSPLVTIDEKKSILGFRTHISEVDVLPSDIQYVDIVSLYFAMIRTSMGFGLSADETETVNLKDIVSNMQTGLGQILPFVPEDLGKPNAAVMNAMFEKLWFLFALRLIASNQNGATAGRIHRVMNERKYLRDDAYDALVNESINVASIAHEAFVLTAGFLKNLMQDDSIYYPNLHPVHKNKMSKVMADMLKYFTTSFMGTQNPNYLLNAAHVMVDMPATLDATYGFICKDTMFKGERKSILDKHSLSMYEVAMGELISGHLLDVETDISPLLLIDKKALNPIDVMYSFATESHQFIREFDLFSALSIFKFEDVFGNVDERFAGIAWWLKDKIEVKYLLSLTEFAQEFGLPLNVASKLYTAPGGYVKLRTMDRHYYTWSPNDPQFFQLKVLDPEKTYIRPVVTTFPFLMERVTSLPQLEIRSFRSSTVNQETGWVTSQQRTFDKPNTDSSVTKDNAKNTNK